MSPPASVTITQLEPVVYLRGQSSTGEDARGRRRPVNFDAPPSQLRALVTVYLPKPSKIKEISVSLKGIARTDWPEGIGPNRVEMVEESPIFQHSISLYNAKQENAKVAGPRPRSNSVGPGIGLQEDVDWEYAAANASARASTRKPSGSSPRQANGTARKDEDRQRSASGSGSGSSNLARQIAGAAAKAGTAIIPPTLRPDLGLSKPKETLASRDRPPPLHRTSSGATSWANGSASTDRNTSQAQSPPATFNNPWSRSASGTSMAASLPSATTTPHPYFHDSSVTVTPPQDLSSWHDYFESQGHERPPLYAPRSAPLQGYDSWPCEVTAPPEDATTSSSQITTSVDSAASSATLIDRTAASSIDQPRSDAAPASSTSIPSSRSILHTQPAITTRPREQQTVRFDPPATVVSTNSTPPKLNSNRSAPSSRRNSVEVQDKNSAKSKSSNKAGTVKKPNLKTLINGLLKEPAADHRTSSDDTTHSDSKEFKKGSYTYPISISLPSNLPPTLHADFGFNRYVLKANVVRAGPLTPNLVAEREVTLIHAPDEDALEETDSIVVERCWEDLLSYMVVFSGKSFPVGQKIPLWLKFVPLGKVKIYRILATLEERTDYFAKGRRVARHEVPRKWTLLKVGHASATEPILPILSDSADALDKGPLAAMAKAAAGEDENSDALPSILDPTGPWELATELMIPACGTTRINISTNHSKSNIAVHHLVRLSIRVGRSQGDWESLDDSGGPSSSKSAGGEKKAPQLYDIIIEAPITVMASHTASEWTALPNYWSLPAEPADRDRGQDDSPTRPALPPPIVVSRTAVGGRNTSPSPSPLLSSPSAGNGVGTSPPMSRNPTQLSRRWLALSADHMGRDGNNTGSGSSSVNTPPPPAYRENARTGETTVAATSMSRSPSQTEVSGHSTASAAMAH